MTSLSVTRFVFFSWTGDRTTEERKWHPEFCDSMMQRQRHAVLKNGAVLHEFTVGGVHVRSGDMIKLELPGGVVLDQVIVGTGGFAGRDAGVKNDESVHAGDFTMPCSRRGSLLGILNARHWLPEKHGHMTWHPNGLPVQRVERIEVEQRGTLPSTAHEAGCDDVSEKMYSGPDGQPSFKMCIALFMDDFVARAGRSSSACGVYLLYLSWCFRHRTSRHAVRPISLAPAAVESDSMLGAISDDLVKGATEGWLVKKPDGRSVRVMADVAM